MDVQDRTSTARDSALADMSGPGQANVNGPGPNAAPDALERPNVPDGVFRILLVVAGSAAGNSILELIAALSKVSRSPTVSPPPSSCCYPKPSDVL